MTDTGKMSPFDVLSNINSKGGILDVADVGYEPFVINRALSNTQDSIFFANEMNAAYDLPKDMQYAFYYHGLPKKKRYGKWHKNQDDKELMELLMEYTGYSYQKVKSVLPILMPHLDEIKKTMEKGGKTTWAKAQKS